MLDTHANQIKELFKKYSLKGYIKIKEWHYKSLEYAELTWVYAFDETNTKDVIITFIKKWKKIVYHLDKLNFDEIWKIFKWVSKIINKTDTNENIFFVKVKWDFEDMNPTIDNIEKLDINFFNKIIAPVRDYKFKKNIKLEWFSYSISDITNIFINSDAVTKTYKKTLSNYSIELAYLSDNFNDLDYYSETSTELLNIDTKNIKDIESRLIDKANFKKIKSETKKINIALNNSVAWELLWIFLSLLSAELIIQKQSPYTLDDLNTKIISDKISIINNPLEKNNSWYTPFDSEWLEQKKVNIIEKGILKNIFLDSKNANKLWIKHNFNSFPTFITLKSDVIENRLKDAKFEFIDIMWLHTIDMMTGKFSLVWEWYIIEKEQRKEYIKNVHISWNIKDLFNSIISTWNDIDTTWTMYVPTIVFANQDICF